MRSVQYLVWCSGRQSRESRKGPQKDAVESHNALVTRYKAKETMVLVNVEEGRNLELDEQARYALFQGISTEDINDSCSVRDSISRLAWLELMGAIETFGYQDNSAACPVNCIENWVRRCTCMATWPRQIEEHSSHVQSQRHIFNEL